VTCYMECLNRCRMTQQISVFTQNGKNDRSGIRRRNVVFVLCQSCFWCVTELIPNLCERYSARSASISKEGLNMKKTIKMIIDVVLFLHMRVERVMLDRGVFGVSK